MIVDPEVNVTLMIEDKHSSNENSLDALAPMDVVLPNRKISATKYEQLNATMYKNTHRINIANNTILDCEKD